MKIAVFTDLYLDVAGGIPSSIQAQKKALEELGHTVVVFCPGLPSSHDVNVRDEHVVLVPTCRHFRVNGAPLARNPRDVMSLVVQRYPMFCDFDLVHVHYEAGCSIAGVLLAKEFKLPLVQTMHGREDMAIAVNIPHPFKTVVGLTLNAAHDTCLPHKWIVLRDDALACTIARAEMWTLMVNQANYADQVITPSKHFAKKLKHYGVKKPINVVSNGVADVDVVKALSKESAWPRREWHANEPLRLIWNSRVSREKRIMPFLAAIRELKDAPVLLSVYGSGNDLAKAKKYVRQFGLDKRVRFYGAIPHEQMLSKMREQHLAVMASYGFDTQGLTLLEAEATGLPVMFCDADMAEVVPAGGSLQASGPSSHQMAVALRKVLNEPTLIQEMSQVMLENQREALQSTQIEKLLEVYRTALLHSSNHSMV